jgi:hypothetical protein
MMGRNLGFVSSAGCNSESFGWGVRTYKSKQIKRVATKVNKVHHREFSLKKTNTQPAKKTASENHRTRLNVSRIFGFRSPSAIVPDIN